MTWQKVFHPMGMIAERCSWPLLKMVQIWGRKLTREYRFDIASEIAQNSSFGWNNKCKIRKSFNEKRCFIKKYTFWRKKVFVFSKYLNSSLLYTSYLWCCNSYANFRDGFRKEVLLSCKIYYYSWKAFLILANRKKKKTFKKLFRFSLLKWNDAWKKKKIGGKD